MHGIGTIDNIPNTFYFNSPGLIFDIPDWKLSDEKIKKLPRDQLIIADFSNEHYGDSSLIAETIYDRLVSYNINFVLLTHNLKDHLTRPRLFFYAHWYHWSVNNFEKLSPVETIAKTYNLSCMNSNHRFARIYNYLTLKNHSDFNNWRFVIRKSSTNDPTRTDDYPLDQNMVDEWDKFPFVEEEWTPGIITDPGFVDSYINLVTESTVIPKIFITEKTWAPIASGQLFLVIGNPGIVKTLEEFGVDTYADIIDHNYYDNEQDWQLRIKKIHSIIDNLVTQDLFYINQVTYQRRKKNVELFFAGAFGKKYYQDLLTCINTLN